MKHIKLFEEFAESGFPHDYDTSFGPNDDYYVEVNLKDRVARVEIPTHIEGEDWYDPSIQIRSLEHGDNDVLVDLINGYMMESYELHIFPVKILLDGDEKAFKVNDNTFIMPLKVEGESYDSWVMKNKLPKWGSRTGKKYGL